MKEIVSDVFDVENLARCTCGSHDVELFLKNPLCSEKSIVIVCLECGCSTQEYPVSDREMFEGSERLSKVVHHAIEEWNEKRRRYECERRMDAEKIASQQTPRLSIDDAEKMARECVDRFTQITLNKKSHFLERIANKQE